MIAKDCGRKVNGVLIALALWVAVGLSPALAQSPSRTRVPAPPADGAAAQTNPAFPALKLTALPVNPGDAIATINGEHITRAQLADECVARKGVEILETLIARKLIEQALRARKLEVTAPEVDQEIDRVAQGFGIGREAWLRTHDKEKGISPVQYARDIIYPALALRKLAGPLVHVEPDDLKKSFEAQYGDKLRCRMIMVDKLQAAKEIWEALQKNPGGFEKLAQERSMDSGSRSLGGLLAEPISRHAYPQNVSDAAFQQLVDGDPIDRDPTHKPKDGDFTGPIQVAEATWVLLRREKVEPARQLDANDARVKKVTYDMIYEVKLKEAMGAVMIQLMQQAAIENKLTGKTKEANEQVDVDQEVKLTGGRSSPSNTSSAPVRGPAAAGAVPQVKTPAPVGVPPEVAKQAEELSQPSAGK